MRRLTVLFIALAFAAGALTDTAGGLGVPCLWRTWLDAVCPGCGLSRAAVLLAQGELRAAAEMNALVFPLAAAAGWRVCQTLMTTWRSVRWRNLAQPN